MGDTFDEPGYKPKLFWDTYECQIRELANLFINVIILFLCTTFNSCEYIYNSSRGPLQFLQVSQTQGFPQDSTMENKVGSGQVNELAVE